VLSLFLRFNAIFPGEAGLAGFIEGSGSDIWSYKSAKLQSNHHHQQTNTQLFLHAGCPSYHPTNSVTALKEKSTFQGLAHPKLIWGSSNFVFDH